MTTKVKIRRPYEKTARSSIKFPNETMAKQSFKDETNINTIMAKYQKTGIVEHVQKVQGSYGDFSNVQEYQLSLNQVIEAQEAFDQLPALIRKRFNNDPAHLMSFLEDDKNRDEAIKLGLIDQEAPPPPPQKVEIVNPPEKKSGATPQTPPKKVGEAPAE